MINTIGSLAGFALVLAALWLLRLRLIAVFLLLCAIFILLAPLMSHQSVVFVSVALFLLPVGVISVSVSAALGKRDRLRAIGVIEEYVEVHSDGRQFFTTSRKTVPVSGGVHHEYVDGEKIEWAAAMVRPYLADPNFASARVDFNARQVHIDTFDRSEQAAASLAEALMISINPPPIRRKTFSF